MENKIKINLQGNLKNQRNQNTINSHKLSFNQFESNKTNNFSRKFSTIENNKEIIFAVIRHGERADLAGIDIKLNKSDPELTDRGIKQSYEAGIRLNEILDSLKPENKKIALITSPFSRCLMTSKYLKNGMNLNLPLFLENGLSEFINTQWFNSNPSEFLCYLNLNKHKFLLKEISNEIILDKSTQKLPIFPESTHKCKERFSNSLNDIINNYCNDNRFNVVILVSHFFGIQSLLEKMNIPLENFDIEYCSTFIFRYDKETKEFKFENNFYPIEEELY